ncbi:Pollen-specific leucine-rich repeat extensin-like protein 3 [Hibiscus syriacus]|uniref:Cell wall hydroxyproline-rich glycoprotein n=1 Tax=Hibiscus syriacus TaxID=106335 RepID=A0A6A3C3K3_HIBSY|nr:Pollen-specific leucine-rich repeat extensin-like protein 3 [Hibiscus syriacus]
MNITRNWFGPNVCSYRGVFCAPALGKSKWTVVAGIDLNHAGIVGYIPVEFGLLTDLALHHLNSNRFCGIIPRSLSKLTRMYEFDISNNRFSGSFPRVVTTWKSIRYIDLRFNNFEGCLPPEIFEKDLNALFLNDNHFTCTIPETLGKSTVSAVTFANNKFKGCLPRSVGEMWRLVELIFTNNELGGLPQSLSSLKKIDILDVPHNKLTGTVLENVCKLPSLFNFTVSYNYFSEESSACVSLGRDHVVLDDTGNRVAGRTKQKLAKECQPVVSRPVDCNKNQYVAVSSYSTPNSRIPKSKPLVQPHTKSKP